MAFEHHRLKGDKERLLSERLSDLDLHHPPCKDQNANWSFYTLAGLEWNFMQALKRLHLPESQAPKRLRTLIRHLLLVPVELKRHARQFKACLYAPAGWVAWWRGDAGGIAAALSGVERCGGERFGLRARAGAESFPRIFRRATCRLARGVPGNAGRVGRFSGGAAKWPPKVPSKRSGRSNLPLANDAFPPSIAAPASR